jgi:hypothetical protein
MTIASRKFPPMNLPIRNSAGDRFPGKITLVTGFGLERFVCGAARAATQ